MKIIFALALILFVFGCGSSSPPRYPAIKNPPPQPQTGSQTSTDNTAGAAKNPEATPQVEAVAPQPTEVPMAFATPPPQEPEDYHQSVLNTISSQEDLLEREQTAFNRAVKAKDKDVHFTKDFLIAIGAGLGSGALTWDFLHRTGIAKKGPLNYYRKFVPRENTSFGEIPPAPMPMVDAETAEASSLLAKTTSGVSALILGYFAVSYAINIYKDYVIHFSSTDEIRAHEKNIADARANLARAHANLHAIWNTPNGAVPQN